MKNWINDAFDIRDVIRDCTDPWAWATVAVVASALVSALWLLSWLSGEQL